MMIRLGCNSGSLGPKARSWPVGAISSLPTSLILALVLVFLGCTSHPKPAIAPSANVITSIPDSLRAKLVFTVPAAEPGSTEEISGVLFAVPGKRYRMELTGTLGLELAKLLWTPEGWTALVPHKEQYVQGVGEVVQIPGLLLPPVSVHRLLAFTWDSGASQDSASTGVPGLRIERSADSVRISQGDRWLMSMRLKDRRTDAKWGAGVWKLVVPEGYKKL